MSNIAINDNAKQVLERRYLARDENGELIEDIEQMFKRVASAIAAADRRYIAVGSGITIDEQVKESEERFFKLMTELKFLPNSPTLMNAGRPLGQLSACFVLPIEDSMEAIFEAVKNAALIHKSGGGTGFSFSRLRPNGSVVNSTGGVASGPVSFMRVFNMATEAVKQGGTRRGANMGILRVDHPDIMEFIDCKKNNADITNFNISVGITEEFMRAVEAGEDYDLVDPHTGVVTGELDAAEVFAHIVEAAWNNGEPGIIFLDRLNRDNVVASVGKIEATNPCGEQPLLPYESCNLGSINLVKMLTESEGGTSRQIDWGLLAETVDEAVHFLDNVIEVNNYPLEHIAETTLGTRKIGLGVMGFADMLLLLDIAYNSDEAVALADRLMAFITTEGRSASRRLAQRRGGFPLFGESVFKDDVPLRNATVTTIAPTGTLSMIAGCSSGVEPVFAYAYIRTILDGTEMVETSPILRAALEERGLYSEELMRKVIAAGSIRHIEEIPEDMKSVFVCAHDISPEYHIRLQAAFQRHTDNAVSKTVNFPSTAKAAEIAEVYKLAYKEGCKGVTIYRDQSRESQVLSVPGVQLEKGVDDAATSAAATTVSCAPASEEVQTAQVYGEISPRPRPEITQGFTERMKIGCGNLYVTVNYDENGICEVFTSTGKAGGCPSQSEATARLASVALRSGMSVQEVYAQLKGIRCPSTVRQSGMSCTSCPDAIAKVVLKVSKHIEAGKAESAAALEPEPLLTGRNKKALTRHELVVAGPRTPAKESAATGIATMANCPECGHAVEHEGGCVICRQCGYSKCG